MKHHEEISRRLVEVPRERRQRELAPQIVTLGEAAGDQAWQIYRAYLDQIEAEIAPLVRKHSPGFWFHLDRRLRPMLADARGLKDDDTTVLLVQRIAELAYAKHGALEITGDLGPITRTRLPTFLDDAWSEAMAHVYGGKLKAKKAYQALRESGQIVMTDFRLSDLIDVFAIDTDTGQPVMRCPWLKWLGDTLHVRLSIPGRDLKDEVENIAFPRIGIIARGRVKRMHHGWNIAVMPTHDD